MAAKKEKKGASEKEPKKQKATQRLKIRLKGYDHKVLDESCREIVKTAQRHGVEVVGPVPLPTEIHRYTVNRSTFIYSTSKEQFEMRIHKRLIELIKPNPELVDSLMRLALPAGVKIEIKT